MASIVYYEKRVFLIVVVDEVGYCLIGLRLCILTFVRVDLYCRHLIVVDILKYDCETLNLTIIISLGAKSRNRLGSTYLTPY